MDNNTLNRLSIGISVLWLILLMFRMAMYSSAFLATPEGKFFSDVLNVFLIIGIVIIAFFLVRRFTRYSAAKTMKGSHCQQCYARIPKGEMFCPKCGWAKPGYEPDDNHRKED